eukprot:TRINITY_DN4058_c0_g1_i10.p1 TRINITY_DN4058_c0_g1~~TRINITY_DN4058_c0_g1_i10.p1  ORF type:complete len:533 (+),score=147.72 TRINITY_DN4058_c0_g1_i10:48-1646(+)
MAPNRRKDKIKKENKETKGKRKLEDSEKPSVKIEAKTEKENVPEQTPEKEEKPQTEKPKKSHKKRQKGLYKLIGAQLEFYFSDANLRRDGYVSQLIEKDPWVDLSEFFKFNKIRGQVESLEGDRTFEEHLAKALQVKKSEMLELSEDSKKVKRVTDVVRVDNPDPFTIYVENFPPDSNHDSLKKTFKTFGNVVYVSMPKYAKTQKSKGFAFIEFDSVEAVTATMQACGGSLDADSPAESKKELMSITSYNIENQVEGETTEKEEVNDDGESINTEDPSNLPPSPKRLKLDESAHDGNRDIESNPSENLPTDTSAASPSDKEIEMGNLHGLRILTKHQWKKMRNQYLNQQRENVARGKRQMRLQQAAANSSYPSATPQYHHHHHNHHNNSIHQQQHHSQQHIVKNEATAPVDFEKGLIVKVCVEEQLGQLKTVKQKVRDLDENVAYIDCKIGQTQFYVRLKNSEDTDRFMKNKVDGWKLMKLEGEEEAEYWKTIAKDMADKKSGKVVVPKRKKKAIIFEKLEQHKNTHTFFTE